MIISFSYLLINRLQSFWKLNRNFRRIINNDDNSKIRQLKFGRLAVVSLLVELPKTQHDPQSFTVDLTLFTVSHVFVIIYCKMIVKNAMYSFSA